jgi:hypothetical protein
MTAMWDTGTISIGEIIGHVDRTTMGLPQFQRLSVWGKADWLPFLTTVLLGRPAGTLLLLEAGVDTTEFAPRQIEGGPPLGAQPLKWLLLDGQQRTTTIYKVFVNGIGGPRGPIKDFVLDVKSALRRGELQDNDLDLVNASRIAPVAELAESGKVTLKTLLSDALRMVWMNSYVASHIPGDHNTGLETLVEDLASVIPAFNSIASYKFPVLEVKSSAPLDVIVDIFEGMNRRGQKLNQFDLMVARLYKPIGARKYYDLRGEFESALANSPNLRLLGVDEEDGLLPLQLIAMQLTRLPDGVRPPRIKSLTTRDVLEIPVDQIIGRTSPHRHYPTLDLHKAMEALEWAATFLSQHCGVISARLLPQQSMLLPLADQYLLGQGRLSNAELKRWFFAVGLSIDYYGSVNFYADRDCRMLHTWAQESDRAATVPENVSRLSKDSVALIDFTQPLNREGAILGASLMALLVADGAKDWRPGQLAVKDLGQSVDFHHTVPENVLKNIVPQKADRRPIANFAPITDATNRSLGDEEPRKVARSLGRDAGPIFKSHYVDRSLYEAAGDDKKSFEMFLADRNEALKKFVVKALGL